MDIFSTTSAHFSKECLFLLKFFLAQMLSEVFFITNAGTKGETLSSKKLISKSDIKQERKKKPDFLARFTNQCTGSTKTRNPESGNGNGIAETETETEYGICERRFQAIDLKKRILAMTMK